MDTRQQRYLFILKTPSTGGASLADEAAFDFDSLDNGEGVFVDIFANTVETVLTTAGTYHFIAKTSNGDQLVSPKIKTTNVIKSSGAKYIAPVQKVDHIGSNGTTGSFPVGDNEDFTVTITVKDGSKARMVNRDRISATYSTTSGATEQEVVTYLTKDLGTVSAGVNGESYDLKVELIHDDAGDAIGTGVDNVVFTKGSRTITATDIDDATTNPALAVGKALRVGTTVTSPIYIIEAIDATNNTATLHMPYQGESTTIADTGLEQITAADLTAGSFGIQITGTEDTEWKRNHREYKMTNWLLETSGSGFEDAPTTLIKNTTALTYPRGLGKQVADKEFRSRQAFSDGMQNPNDSYTNDDQLKEAVTTTKYDIVEIQTKDNSYTGLGAASDSLYSIQLAVPATNQSVTIPATVDNATAYELTIDGTTYSFTTDASATTAELYAGLLALLVAGGEQVSGNGSNIIYAYGAATITTNSGTTTNDIVIAADTTVRYPTWATMFA